MKITHDEILKRLKSMEEVQRNCTAIGKIDHSLNHACDTITVSLKRAFKLGIRVSDTSRI